MNLYLKILLRKFPAYTPLLVALEEPKAALLLKVEDVAPFRAQGLPIQVGFCLYAHQETHLGCVPFRVLDLEGDAYLNPRQVADRIALGYLGVQENLPLMFANESLSEWTAKAIPWRETSRSVARELFQATSGMALRKGDFDPEFQRLKEEFQAKFGVKDLL